MSERENEEQRDQAVDPPENQGGGNMSMDSPEAQASAVDPPENQGGGN
jgi:hypothetical protein